MNCQITWYGRCCFLVELDKKKILFDPYDRFCNVEIGYIDAHILISSSTWHDHGHIGAAPGAWIYTYPGTYNHEGIQITGIEAVEERGTPTVVFNLSYNDISITNFADMGTYDKKNFTTEQLTLLQHTNIAFLRSGHEKVLDFCSPKLLFPEHYLPTSFIEEQIPQSIQSDFKQQVDQAERMLSELSYEVKEVNDFQYKVNSSDLIEQKVIQLLKIHPQVTFVQEYQTRSYW